MNCENWRSCLLPHEASIGSAIACLDHSGLQIALLVNAQEQLVGTITDGDIRRGLLRGLGLDGPAAAVAHIDPMVVPPIGEAHPVYRERARMRNGHAASDAR